MKQQRGSENAALHESTELQDRGHVVQHTSETSFPQAVPEKPKRRQRTAANENSSLKPNATKRIGISLPILATTVALA